MRYHWGLSVGHLYTHDRTVRPKIPEPMDVSVDECSDNFVDNAYSDTDAHSLRDSDDTWSGKGSHRSSEDFNDTQSDCGSSSRSSEDSDSI